MGQLKDEIQNDKVTTKDKGSITVDYSAESYIVGIGASAGGLEPLRSFMGNVPDNCGLSFIIVQHMDPLHKDLLVDILQTDTTMKVVQVEENMSVHPNCVYIIPPNKNMFIQDRVLHLSDNPSPHTLRLPINFFFRSLADDLQEKSIGVILSGMGTDGTLGLKAIKEKGGTVFVQEPISAKFDSMPRSAIEAGLADVIAPAESLPAQIIAQASHHPLAGRVAPIQAEKAPGSFEKVIQLLLTHTGTDFSAYKKNTVYRRIERRLVVHEIDKMSTYVQYLQKNPQELELLFKELLIGVTSFFREPHEWELLKRKVLPGFLSKQALNDTIRVWIPGCTSGEEAYSLAIAFKEVLDELRPSREFSMQIFATDLDRDAIDKAREGVYPVTIAESVSPERLERYFVKVDRGYQVVRSMREMVIFAQQNIIKDPPFTKIDLLICRNLLIYLTVEMQKKLIPLFHYSLNPDGFLFLGSAETVGSFTNLFKQLERKSRLYKRLQPLLRTEPVEFPTSFTPAQSITVESSKIALSIQAQTDKLVLQSYSPATVLANDKGDILYITGRTGKYLEPAAGKVNWNIFAMAREGLNYTLSNAFYQALRQKEEITVKNAVVINEAGPQMLEIIINPLKEPEVLKGSVLIVFKDLDPTTNIIEMTNTGGQVLASNQREITLERELMQVRHMWQNASAEMQLSQEELKSSNEELQSSNEELQSTNEELTTTKEEIQSLNEELNTVNYELLARVDDLVQANTDMKNLMDSTNIATLFLDNSLCVKRFTKQMSVISRLRMSDVGRPVTDIASNLFYPQLPEDVSTVRRTLNTVEKQVKTDDGAWFNVRILPYRTLEDKIDGVVITFMDITEAKILESELRKAKAILEQSIVDQDEDLRQIRQGLRQVAASKDPPISEK